MAKILVINLPAYGHINPTIAVVKELVERGHEVTYLITEEFREKIETTGATVICYDKSTSRSNSLVGMFGCTKKAYKKAMEIGKDYDCIVYEMIFRLGEQLGQALNKPTVEMHSVFALNKEVLDDIMSTFGLALRIGKLKPIRKMLTKIFLGRNVIKDNDMITELIENKTNLNIVYTSQKFQPRNNDFNTDYYKFVGSSIIDRKQDIHIPFEQISGKLIYISMGTIFNRSVAFFKKCIKAYGNSNVTVIMSVGRHVKIEDLGQIPENFIVYPFVPQLEVLKHADLFITHGGMNSINEAICYGVPVIVIPQEIDQPMVANRIIELGLGKRMDKHMVTVEILQQTAREVLGNADYKNAMKSMSEDMKQCGGYKYAASEIENYINSTVNNQYKKVC